LPSGGKSIGRSREIRRGIAAARFGGFGHGEPCVVVLLGGAAALALSAFGPRRGVAASNPAQPCS
jgi:hypothetical protein